MEGVQGAGFLGRREAGDQSHAYFAERTIRTIKKAMLRRACSAPKWPRMLNEIAWSEKEDRAASAESGEMGGEVWPGG